MPQFFALAIHSISPFTDRERKIPRNCIAKLRIKAKAGHDFFKASTLCAWAGVKRGLGFSKSAAATRDDT
jgi:hypothetical protein